MKYWLRILITFTITFSFPVIVSGGSFTIGSKLWFPVWTSDYTDNTGTYEDVSERASVFGFSGSYSTDRLVFGTNLFHGEFDFVGRFGQVYTEARTEMDLYGGYSASEYFTLIAGIKYINFEFNDVNNIPVNVEYMGPVIGVNAHKFIGTGKKIIVFGTGALAYLGNSGDSLDYMFGPAIELGVAAVPSPVYPLTLHATYKYQLYEYADGYGTWSDAFSGITLGLSYVLNGF